MTKIRKIGTVILFGPVGILRFGIYLFIRSVMPIGRHRLPRALKLLCGGAADGAAHHPS
jgi:hypothetical protein